jgi:hypothetical protein
LFVQLILLQNETKSTAENRRRTKDYERNKKSSAAMRHITRHNRSDAQVDEK